MEDRIAYIANLDKFIDNTRIDLKLLMERFNWDERLIKRKFTDKRQSPLDSSLSITSPQRLEDCQTDEKVFSSIPLKNPKSESTSLKNVDAEEKIRYRKNFPVVPIKSELDEIALNRDLKRRRTKYKVSNKHPRYTAVLKEIIEDRMQLLLENRSEKNSSTLQEKKHGVR